MSEVKGGSVRFRPDEFSAGEKAVLGAQLTEKNGWLYLTSPFDQTPWTKFDANPPGPKPVALPAGFVEIFGNEGDYVEEGDKTAWRQELGLYRDANIPDSVTAGQKLLGETLAKNYGLGRVLPYRLTNGASYVYFPDANKAAQERVVGFRLPAGLFYEYPEHAIAGYQSILRAAGVAVPNLVPFLDPKNRLPGHSG